jgi:hypothetical protein
LNTGQSHPILRPFVLVFPFAWVTLPRYSQCLLSPLCLWWNDGTLEIPSLTTNPSLFSECSSLYFSVIHIYRPAPFVWNWLSDSLITNVFYELISSIHQIYEIGLACRSW